MPFLRLARRLYRSSLHRNATFLISNRVFTTLLGFVFWTIAARIYTDGQVGLASAGVSAMNLLSQLSLFGMGSAIIRFLPPSDRKRELLGTTMSISLLMTIVFTTIFVMGAETWSPVLRPLINTPLSATLFVLVAVPWTWQLLLDGVYNAHRKSQLVVLRGAILGLLKLGIMPLFVGWGAYGIFGSWMIGVSASVIVAILIMKRQVGFRFPKPVPNVSIFRELIGYSFASYIGSILLGVPTTMVPLLVALFLREEMIAYYYVGWMVGSILHMVPGAVAVSYIAEGSHDPSSAEAGLKRARKFAYIFVLPAALMLFIFAPNILLIFGKSYSDNATWMLRLLAITAPVYTYNSLFMAWKKIERRLKWIIMGNVTISVGTLMGSILGLDSIGISAVAYGFIGGNLVLFFVALFSRSRGRLG